MVLFTPHGTKFRWKKSRSGRVCYSLVWLEHWPVFGRLDVKVTLQKTLMVRYVDETLGRTLRGSLWAAVRERWPDHRRKVSAEGSSSTSARCSVLRASPRLRGERKKKRPCKNVTRSRCVGSRQQSQGAISNVWKWSNNNNNLSWRLKKHFGLNKRDVESPLQESFADWVLNVLTLMSE